MSEIFPEWMIANEAIEQQKLGVAVDSAYIRGARLGWSLKSKSYDQLLSDARELQQAFNELIESCEWYADKGTHQELHHFLAVEARGNHGQQLETFTKKYGGAE